MIENCACARTETSKMFEFKSLAPLSLIERVRGRVHYKNRCDDRATRAVISGVRHVHVKDMLDALFVYVSY